MGTALFDRLRRETSARVAGRELPGYELGNLLAAGSGGQVYLARQRGAAGRTVALKRLAPGADEGVVARLCREGQILAGLDHPHIVRIYELVPDGDSLAIAMQYALGGSLADRLSRQGALAPAQVTALVSRCADALASAHRRGILHRDVKPANILFTSDGEPLLSDFGVARWNRVSGLTGHGITLGTAGYLAPEVVDGGEPTERSDIYSLGVVAYEALVGRPPFRGYNEVAIMRAADRGEFVALADAAPQVPAALAAVVERAMAREPADRFADAGALGRAVRSVFLGGPTPSSGSRLDVEDAAPRPSSSSEPPARRASTGRSLSSSQAPTGLFGPRPPEPAPPKRRRLRLPRPRLRFVRTAIGGLRRGLSQRRRVHGLRISRRRALIAVVVVAAVVLLVARPGWPHAPARPTVSPRPAPPTNVVELRVRPGEPPTRFSLGQPGDIALLGDWQCRGVPTPAIYRPETGQVFVFDGWANPDRSLTSSSSTATGIRNGRPVVVHAAGGCDHIEVRPA